MKTTIDIASGFSQICDASADFEALLNLRQGVSNLEKIEVGLIKLLAFVDCTAAKLKEERAAVFKAVNDSASIEGARRLYNEFTVNHQAIRQSCGPNSPLRELIGRYVRLRLNQRAVWYGRKYGGGFDRGMRAPIGDWPGEKALLLLSTVQDRLCTIDVELLDDMRRQIV